MKFKTQDRKYTAVNIIISFLISFIYTLNQSFVWEGWKTVLPRRSLTQTQKRFGWDPMDVGYA